jgi:septal ring factor EnvC (AmiA/AmiB activator)
MEFWAGQLEQAQQQIAELESKIAVQQQKLEQLRAQGLDQSLALRTLAVIEDSLARARFHVQHIEHRIAAIEHEPVRQRRLAAARKSLASGNTRLG